MKVSVLVANYNNGKYFGDCYESLLQQTYTNWEAIIIDDKSSDNSVEVIESIICGDGRFSLHKLEENKGVGFVKRRLAELANGEIAVFLDPDDVILPTALELIVRQLHEGDNLVAAYTGYSLCNENLNNCKQVTNYPFGKRERLTFWQTGIGSVHPLFGFKLSLYKRTTGINPSYRMGEDLDLYLKLEEFGDFYRLKENAYLVRRHASSLTADHIATRSWKWVMQVLYDNGKRRVENKIFSYEQYMKLVLEKLLFCLMECKAHNDKETFESIRKCFFTNPFHIKMLSSFVFYKYLIRHIKLFVW